MTMYSPLRLRLLPVSEPGESYFAWEILTGGVAAEDSEGAATRAGTGQDRDEDDGGKGAAAQHGPTVGSLQGCLSTMSTFLSKRLITDKPMRVTGS